jgi:asparagine synthase (glutamine-hydrolysing)
MSAQAGIWNFRGDPTDPHLLSRYSSLLQELGPEGAFTYSDGPVALAYRPFHTTAESRRERQPYVSRRGFVITWDGRLDNRDELTAELGTYLEGAPTDVSIIAAAFDRWGTGCFRRIVGDWAMAVWEPLDRELCLAVDYLAIRHLFYRVTDRTVFWATDPAPLVRLSESTFHLDDEYIAGFLTTDPESHLSPFKEIQEVPAGHFVRIKPGSSSIERYWHPGPKLLIRYATDAEYEEHFRDVFRRAVRRRLRSDSPILAELSGGIDSSSIVCVADDILAHEGAETPRVDTLSKHDTTEPNGDDWTFFQKIEEKRGRTGHHIDTANLAGSRSGLQYDTFAALPGRIGIGRALEAERAAVIRGGGYRTVLSGIGGDEFLGGIPDPCAQLGDLLFQLKLGGLWRKLIEWSLVKRTPWIQLLASVLIDLLPPVAARHFLREARPENWIDQEFAKRSRISLLQLGPQETLGFWLPTRRSYARAVLAMANRMAKRPYLKPALEDNRYPYLDQNLIEFVLAIPATQLLRPGQRRSLQRRSLAGLVPAAVLERRTKQFAARTPVLAIGNRWKELEGIFSQSLSSALGYVDGSQFLSAVRAGINGSSIHIVRTVRTISLELWLRDMTARGLLAEPQPAAASAARLLTSKRLSDVTRSLPGKTAISRRKEVNGNEL